MLAAMCPHAAKPSARCQGHFADDSVEQDEATTVSDCLPSSRGGTRTRDPGIMSAVL